MTSREVFPARRIALIEIASTKLSNAAEQIIREAREVGGSGIHLVNAYSIALSSRDKGYRSVLQVGLCLPDGRPLAWVSQIGGGERLYQVRGPALFEMVLDKGRGSGVRHFFLGSTPATLQELVASVTRKYPGVIIAGAESPPFRQLDPSEIAEQDARVCASRPDIVWIGLGTPKQDFEAMRLARATGLTCVAVGAAFDFTAGTKRVAPRWLSQIGLEWLFRLASEPRRLWRRYLIGNVEFLFAVARHWRR